MIEEAAGEQVRWNDRRVPRDDVETTPRDDAARWLRQALAEGRLASKEILQLGERNGYTATMLHKAKPAAGVTVMREGFGPGASWHWVLTAPDHAQHAKTS